MLEWLGVAMGWLHVYTAGVGIAGFVMLGLGLLIPGERHHWQQMSDVDRATCILGLFLLAVFWPLAPAYWFWYFTKGSGTWR